MRSQRCGHTLNQCQSACLPGRRRAVALSACGLTDATAAGRRLASLARPVWPRRSGGHAGQLRPGRARRAPGTTRYSSCCRGWACGPRRPPGFSCPMSAGRTARRGCAAGDHAPTCCRSRPMPGRPSRITSAMAAPGHGRAAVLAGLRAARWPVATEVTSIVYRSCERAGLRPAGAHRLRHAAATAMRRRVAAPDRPGAAARQHRDDGDLCQGRQVGAGSAGPPVAGRHGMTDFRKAAADYLALRRALGFKLAQPGRCSPASPAICTSEPSGSPSYRA